MQIFSKAALLLVLVLPACKSIGPNVLKNDRYNYNIAMAHSSQQELLLNIVRLRYDESPMVLKVGGISGSTSLESHASLHNGISFPSFGRTSGDANTDTSITYSDSPIMNYTPLDDEAFTKQFLQALDLADLGLLLQSSWSIPRVFRVTLQQAGNALNATSSARSTSSHPPEYQNFIDMAYVLRRLQLENAMDVYFEKPGKDEEELIIDIDPHYKFTAKEQAILHKAGIPVHNHQIIFSNNPSGPYKAYIVTRSMLGVLNYLSKGLVVPPEDAKSGVLVTTINKDGTEFDWQSVLRGMIKVYYSEKRPKDAIVSVPYRGRWYYIKDNDSDSKQTLILLANLAGLISRIPLGSDTPIGLARLTR